METFETQEWLIAFHALAEFRPPDVPVVLCGTLTDDGQLEVRLSVPADPIRSVPLLDATHNVIVSERAEIIGRSN